MRLIDRSRIIAYQTCPRQRYLAYEINGTGLQHKSKSLALEFGSAFHEGAAQLLTGAGIEYAVMRAIAYLDERFRIDAVQFDGEIPDDALKAIEYGMAEQMALAEGLLRAWWAFEGEAFLRDFEVIEVEQEGRAALTQTPIGNVDDLILMFRPDALVRDRASGDLYVVSWKTMKQWNSKKGNSTLDQWKHDMQSISECWGLVKRGERIEGVLYKGIIKGRREKDEWDGLYKTDSPLIYGWKRVAPGPAEDAENPGWSWSYRWKDDEINPKTGKQVGHTLGKGWKKVPIWSEYPGGVKQWIEDLSKKRVFPRHMDALQAIFPQSLPVERRPDEVESWRMQTVAQELRIAEKVDEVNGNTGYGFNEPSGRDRLDEEFPQHTHSCHSYSGCPFIPICWEGAPAEVGDLYQIRIPNHSEKENDDE